VTAARALAAEGLDEARRAVDALRDPDAAADLAGAIEQLVATHSSIGGSASLTTTGTPSPLADDAAGALRRAAQEALSNARRHAPGQPTALSLEWDSGAVGLTATTPLADDIDGRPSGAGGGRGLAGLRERMESLGGSAQWAVREGAFVVMAQVPLKKRVTT
jgi:signal transduction histidine kinase